MIEHEHKERDEPADREPDARQIIEEIRRIPGLPPAAKCWLHILAKKLEEKT